MLTGSPSLYTIAMATIASATTPPTAHIIPSGNRFFFASFDLSDLALSFRFILFSAYIMPLSSSFFGNDSDLLLINTATAPNIETIVYVICGAKTSRITNIKINIPLLP